MIYRKKLKRNGLHLRGTSALQTKLILRKKRKLWRTCRNRRLRLMRLKVTAKSVLLKLEHGMSFAKRKLCRSISAKAWNVQQQMGELEDWFVNSHRKVKTNRLNNTQRSSHRLAQITMWQ